MPLHLKNYALTKVNATFLDVNQILIIILSKLTTIFTSNGDISS